MIAVSQLLQVFYVWPVVAHVIEDKLTSMAHTAVIGFRIRGLNPDQNSDFFNLNIVTQSD